MVRHPLNFNGSWALKSTRLLWNPLEAKTLRVWSKANGKIPAELDQTLQTRFSVCLSRPLTSIELCWFTPFGDLALVPYDGWAIKLSPVYFILKKMLKKRAGCVGSCEPLSNRYVIVITSLNTGGKVPWSPSHQVKVFNPTFSIFISVEKGTNGKII